MTKKSIRAFFYRHLLEKPRGKYDAIEKIIEKILFVWWNSLLVLAAERTYQLTLLLIGYLIIAGIIVLLYLSAKGR